MSKRLLTQEVGSLAKPTWRVEGVRNGEVTDQHIEQATEQAAWLGLEPEATRFDFLRIQDDFRCGQAECADEARDQLRYQAARFAVALQEKAGIDILYDGEQDRSEMYQHAIEGTDGFEWRGRLRAFDNKSYRKAACVSNPSLKFPWHTAEVERLGELTDRPIKVPITGAYTLADWSFDEFYEPRGLPKQEARHQLVLSLARQVVRPNIQSLLEQGVEWIQIDEPAATTKPNEVPLFVEAFNESTRDLLGKFGVHVCFSDYSQLFPHVAGLENCQQFSLEFANRDGRELGRDAAHRPAYETLQDLVAHCPDTSVGLGVTSVHEDAIEWPELVRDRILRAVDLAGDPTRIYPSPDCGLRTRSWPVAYDKLCATAEGAHLARDALQ